MPADDKPVVDWLKSQPSILNPKVTREGKFIVVTYDMRVGQSLPNIIESVDKLGYAERGEFFETGR